MGVTAYKPSGGPVVLGGGPAADAAVRAASVPAVVPLNPGSVYIVPSDSPATADPNATASTVLWGAVIFGGGGLLLYALMKRTRK